MAGLRSNLWLGLLLLVVCSSHITSAWQPGIVDYNGWTWTGTVCVYYPDEAPRCGWQVELFFSRTVQYAMSTDASATLAYIGNPTDYYIFTNNSVNGNLASTAEPYCLSFTGAYDSNGSLSLFARMHCVCLYTS